MGVVLAMSVQDAYARSALSERPPLPAMGPSLRKTVAFETTEQPGTIVIRKGEKALYLVTRQGQALRYQISVGRDGFGWTGVVKVGAKTEWPEWTPTGDILKRMPELPHYVSPGPHNPMGARALYLCQNPGVDFTLEPHAAGSAVST